jgi:hypothetical protein
VNGHMLSCACNSCLVRNYQGYVDSTGRPSPQAVVVVHHYDNATTPLDTPEMHEIRALRAQVRRHYDSLVAMIEKLATKGNPQ